MKKAIVFAIALAAAAACSAPTSPTQPTASPKLTGGAKAAYDIGEPCIDEFGRSGYALASGDKVKCVTD
jgi:hypothetical protein